MPLPAGSVAHPRALATIGVVLGCGPATYLGFLVGLFGGAVFFPAGNLAGLALSLWVLWYLLWRWREARHPGPLRVAASVVLATALVIGWSIGLWIDYRFTDPAWNF